MTSLQNMLFILYIIVMLSHPVHGMIGFDCNIKEANITTLSTTLVHECIRNDTRTKEMTEHIQLVQLSDSYPLSVIQCKVEITRLIMNCGHSSHNSLVHGGLATYVKYVTRDECTTMIHTGAFTMEPNIIIHGIAPQSSTTTTATFAGKISVDGTCYPSSYIDSFGSWDNVVVTGSIRITINSYEATISPSSDKIILQSGTTCSLKQESCVDSMLGYTFWSYSGSQACNPNQHIVLYEGPSQKTISESSDGSFTTYMVESGSKVFGLRTTGYYKGCLFNSFTTEHPRLIIVPRTSTGYFLSKSQVPQSSLDLMTYVNAKFVYVDKHVTKSLSLIYLELETQRCMLERKSLRNLLSIAMIDPMEFAYAYMEGPGYSAKLMGEVIHIIRCQSIPVVVRHTPGQCFTELPITVQNTSLFMSPKSRIIQKFGTEVDCDKVLVAQYEIEGRWYGVGSEIHEVPAPTILSPTPMMSWKTTSVASLASSGIYSQDDLERLQERLMNPYEHAAVNNILVRGFQGAPVDTQGLSLVNLMDEKALEKAANDVLSRIWGWFSWFGNITSGIIGLFMVIRLIKFLIDTIIHGKALYELYGFSLALVGAIWDSVTSYLIHRRLITDYRNRRATDEKVELSEVIEESKPLTSIKESPPSISHESAPPKESEIAPVHIIYREPNTHPEIRRQW